MRFLSGMTGLLRKEVNKEDRKAVEQMCEAVEKYAREKAKEAARSSAALLFQNGVSFDIVAKSITQLTRRELEKIYQAAR